MAAFHTMAAGCGGIVHRGVLGPTSCEAEPTVTGLWYAAHGRTAWLGFACPRHADQLIAPRPMLPRDRDVLARRQDRHRTEIAGQRWAGEQEGGAGPRCCCRTARRAGEDVGSTACQRPSCGPRWWPSKSPRPSG